MRMSDLIENYPTSYHMAEDGSWQSIMNHGLLSTSALLSLYGYEGQPRNKLESEWRPDKVPIHRGGLPDAILRDQKPMPPCTLAPTLTDDMSTREWYKLINSKVFFWLNWEDFEIFMDAREYRNSPQLAIVVDTDKLLRRYSDRITLSRINSGSTMADRPSPRGLGTFRSISDYDSPFAKELCVEDGVSGMFDVVISVHRMIAIRKDYNAPRDVRVLEKVWPVT